MSATNTTTNLGLSQFVNTDVPAWRQDYNGDMLKIDNAYTADISGATAETSADPSDYMKLYDVVSGDYKPYILMSSEANKELQCAMFYDRIPLTMKDWVDNKTANLEWMGRARMSAGFNNWGAFIMGGAAVGTTLS